MDFTNFFEDLALLISSDSQKRDAVLDTPFGPAPFGEQNAKCLSDFLSIAKRLGFSPINHQNYIAEFSVGEGEEIGIIGHLDVVPTGDNWLTPPFTLTKIDDKLFARGVSDDKGPTLLALYALKAVVDSGIKFNRKIRFFVGCNEETGWADIDYYTSSVGTFPEYGFSPDGIFPLSYAEKGIYPTEFTIKPFKRFGFINGGTAINQVCDYAVVKPLFVPDQKELASFSLTFDGEKIISHGVAAHGSTPQYGKNAIKPILEYMLFKGEDVGDALNCLFLDSQGVFDMVSEQGSVTLSVNLAEERAGEQVFVCDVRVPYPFTKNDVEQKFNGFGMPFKVVAERHAPTCVPKDGWFVKALLGAYNEVMNTSEEPISMGGSTYARAFKNGCAFGMSFIGVDNGAHKPNEFVTIEQLRNAFEIYRRAIENLVK